MDYGGKDATEAFYALHRHEVLEKFGPKLKVGQLQGYDNKLAPSSWKSLSKVIFEIADIIYKYKAMKMYFLFAVISPIA